MHMHMRMHMHMHICMCSSCVHVHVCARTSLDNKTYQILFNFSTLERGAPARRRGARGRGRRGPPRETRDGERRDGESVRFKVGQGVPVKVHVHVTQDNAPPPQTALNSTQLMPHANRHIRQQRATRAIYCTSCADSEMLNRSCVSHRLVVTSSLRQPLKVASRSGSGRHCRSASLARGLSERRR